MLKMFGMMFVAVGVLITLYGLSCIDFSSLVESPRLLAKADCETVFYSMVGGPVMAMTGSAMLLQKRSRRLS